MTKKQQQELLEILKQHYEHPDKLELNVPYLVLYKKLEKLFDKKE